MDPTSENDGTETAIEPEQREMSWRETILLGAMLWIVLFTSEGALYLYVIVHWIIACISHIAFSGDKSSDENASFFSFIYFMCTLVAFLSIMSHVSGLLVPLFAFCSTTALFLFLLINLSSLESPSSQELFRNVCNKSNATLVLYDGMMESPVSTIIKTYLIIIFFVLTCAAIMFQVTRNEEYMRRVQQPLPPGFYPHYMIREMPVGAVNSDEPPRYSSLEPISPPKPTSTSTVTSPPRYSYWERTFGRNRDRSTSQCSEQSNRVGDEMMTAKSR